MIELTPQAQRDIQAQKHIIGLVAHIEALQKLALEEANDATLPTAERSEALSGATEISRMLQLIAENLPAELQCSVPITRT